jgi:hypothetical protein
LKSTIHYLGAALGGAYEQVSVTLGDCASAERHDPGQRFEHRPHAGDLGKRALRTTNHPAGRHVVLCLMPGTDEAAVAIDGSTGEVGAKVSAFAGDGEQRLAVAYCVFPGTSNRAEGKVFGWTDSLFCRHGRASIMLPPKTCVCLHYDQWLRRVQLPIGGFAGGRVSACLYDEPTHHLAHKSGSHDWQQTACLAQASA